MDELKGPNVQIVLHIREGLGLDFLKSPILVSASLNGYVLDTDPVIPCHAPVFDAELVWEAEKRRFRNLRVQNVPVKVEVFTIGSQSNKTKVGYVLLSLLSAQPCPSTKVVNVNETWHKLLGVRNAGKCCNPQLMMSLTVEDRTSTPTPRNELRMFHNTEAGVFSSNIAMTTPSTIRQQSLTIADFIAESTKTVSSPELQPKLLCEEGLIQIGCDEKNQDLFILGFVLGSAENVDLLLNENDKSVSCLVTYSVFTHEIKTDPVPASPTNTKSVIARFNQKTSLRLTTDLDSLSKYFLECPYVVAKMSTTERDIGICSIDLRKLVPTDDAAVFVASFCNAESALVLHERCFMAQYEGRWDSRENRRPYLDIELSLTYLGKRHPQPATGILTSRSANQLLESSKEPVVEALSLEYKGTSCTHVDKDVASVTYTNITARNTSRYKVSPVVESTGGLQDDIAEMIRKMYETFTISQEKFMTRKLHPVTNDMQVQVDSVYNENDEGKGHYKDNSILQNQHEEKIEQDKNKKEKNCQDAHKDTPFESDNNNPNIRLEVNNNIPNTTQGSGSNNPSSRPETSIENPNSRRVANMSDPNTTVEAKNDNTSSGIEAENKRREEHKEAVQSIIGSVLSKVDRETLMKKFIEELEDWKEKQQEMFKHQLKQKEDYYLEMLSQEWNKRRAELESRLSKGIEQCRNLANDLSAATEDFKLRGFRNTEREKKLADAKNALEQHYTSKYQELRDASQKLEDDMNHQCKLKDMKIEELELKVQLLEKQTDELKAALEKTQKEKEKSQTGFNKEQIASLVEELRCLEEKLDSAIQTKSFFKEQWSRAVRELHLMRLQHRKQLLSDAQNAAKPAPEACFSNFDDKEIEKLIFETNTSYANVINEVDSCKDIGMDSVEMLMPNEKLSTLINQRNKLMQDSDPDENVLNQLNKEIRSLLVNCAS